MELSERIAGWRKWKGLTQTALAGELDLTPSAITMWESGAATPSVKHLGMFVDAIGISMERFYGRVPKAKAA